MPKYNRRYTYIDTLFLEGNFDMAIGSVLLFIGLLLSFVNPGISIIIGIFTGFYFFNSWLSHVSSGEQDYEKELIYTSNAPENIQPTTSAPITDEPTIADKIKAIHIATDFKCPSCGATVNPTDMKCESCGSFLVAAANLPKLVRWGEVEIGRSIQVRHPIKKLLSLSVIYRIYYGELWQKEMRSGVPWTLTGNYFVALGLSNEILLMNWQSRFYLLDSRQPLTDMDINQEFARYARKFAASNQTAGVRFPYKGTRWLMKDIGRFRIEFIEGGAGIQVAPDAVGRFIHAQNDERILIVEDYQTGGTGLDTLWMGYKIKEKDIKI